jgi:PPOX class probable F420-dependent enzyme
MSRMTDLKDQAVQDLLAQTNFAVISTLNQDGSIHSKVVWVSAENGSVAVNTAVGRKWPTNLERDPRTTILVTNADNGYEFVEIRGTAKGTLEGADEHIDALAKKYIGQDKYPYRQPGEQRIKYVIEPEHVSYVKQ